MGKAQTIQLFISRILNALILINLFIYYYSIYLSTLKLSLDELREVLGAIDTSLTVVTSLIKAWYITVCGVVG